LSGRGLCDELITRPEESYRLWCVVVCDLETSRICAPYIYDISRLRVNSEVTKYPSILAVIVTTLKTENRMSQFQMFRVAPCASADRTRSSPHMSNSAITRTLPTPAHGPLRPDCIGVFSIADSAAVRDGGDASDEASLPLLSQRDVQRWIAGRVSSTLART